jgi:hypothetical protein
LIISYGNAVKTHLSGRSIAAQEGAVGVSWGDRTMCQRGCSSRAATVFLGTSYLNSTEIYFLQDRKNYLERIGSGDRNGYEFNFEYIAVMCHSDLLYSKKKVQWTHD